MLLPVVCLSAGCSQECLLMTNIIEQEGTAQVKVTACEGLSTDEEGDIIFFPPSAWGSDRTAYVYKAQTEEAVQVSTQEFSFDPTVQIGDVCATSTA